MEINSMIHVIHITVTLKHDVSDAFITVTTEGTF